MVEKSSILRTVPFKDFSKWDVKRFFIKQIQSSYPVLFLSELLNEETEKKKLSKYPEEEFGILGVSNEVGMFDAYTEKGRNINQPYKIVKNDFIAYNPYRACMQNGKCAVVKDLKQGFGMGSTEFHVFRAISDDVIPEYLHSLLRTKMLRKAAMNYFTGSSGQQRVSSEFIENLYIPLPPLPIQKEIVSHINKIKKQVKDLRKQVKDIREQAKKNFEGSIFE